MTLRQSSMMPSHSAVADSIVRAIRPNRSISQLASSPSPQLLNGPLTEKPARSKSVSLTRARRYAAKLLMSGYKSAEAMP